MGTHWGITKNIKGSQRTTSSSSSCYFWCNDFAYIHRKRVSERKVDRQTDKQTDR